MSEIQPDTTMFDEPTVTAMVDGVPVDSTMSFLVEKYGSDAPTMVFAGAKHDMISAVHKGFDDTIQLVTGNASIPERDTWKSKEEAARALIAGTANPAQIQMIEIEAQYRGEEPAVLAQSIIAKADRFLLVIGLAAGVRSKSINAINAATTPAQLEAAVIQGRKDMAEALAQLPQ